MSGSRAKQTRRAVYGDQSIRQRREYRAIVHQGLGSATMKRLRDLEAWTKTTFGPSVTIINRPGTLRAAYQAAKRHLAAMRKRGAA